MQPPRILSEVPDGASLTWLRWRITARRTEGARPAELAREIGVGDQTLRKFLASEEQRPSLETWAQYRIWYAKELGQAASGELQAKATRALALIQEGHALLSEVVALIPMSDDIAASVAAMDAAMPTGRPGAPPVRRTADESAK